MPQPAHPSPPPEAPPQRSGWYAPSNMARHVLTLLSFCLLASCSPVLQLPVQSHLHHSHCHQHGPYRVTGQEVPAPLAAAALDSGLLRRFPFQTLNMAHAIGILPLLREQLGMEKQLRQQATLENRQRYLELSQQLYLSINNASLAVAAVAAEINCEEERARQAAAFISAKEENVQNHLTIAAILASAAGAVATGIIVLSGASEELIEWVGIGGGAVEISLGVAALRYHREVRFNHENNILREVWTNHGAPVNFPAPVWYYLNFRNPQQPDEMSPRGLLIEQWKSLGYLPAESKQEVQEQVALLLSEGGNYTAEQLTARADMLEQLEAVVQLMHQQLQELNVRLQQK